MPLPEAFQVVTDPKIPTLAGVLDPMELRRHLEIFSLPPWRWGDLSDVRVRVLRFHSGRRCTMELTVRTTVGLYAVVAKVFAQDGVEVYQAMERISQAGFGPEAEFSIPKPLAFLPALHLLLQEKVRGPLAEDIFLTATERFRAAASERCARWLVRFHAAAPMAGPVFDLNTYLNSLERWSRRIAEQVEPLAAKASRLFQRLEFAALALGPIETCAGHGDYKPSQVILANGRTVTCDWDRYDVADPSRDLARFIVAIQRLALRGAGSIRALDTAAEVFLKTYLAGRRPELESRLPFYKAGACLQFAKYDLAQPITRWREEIEALLDEGLRILEESE